METTLQHQPMQQGPNKLDTLFPAAVRLPRDRTHQDSQGCCPENWRQMGSRLVHLMILSCRASCASTQTARSQEANCFPFLLPKAGSLTRGHSPGHPTCVLCDLVRGGRLPPSKVIAPQGADRVMELCKALQTPLQQLESPREARSSWAQAPLASGQRAPREKGWDQS